MTSRSNGTSDSPHYPTVGTDADVGPPTMPLSYPESCLPCVCPLRLPNDPRQFLLKLHSGAGQLLPKQVIASLLHGVLLVLGMPTVPMMLLMSKNFNELVLTNPYTLGMEQRVVTSLVWPEMLTLQKYGKWNGGEVTCTRIDPVLVLPSTWMTRPEAAFCMTELLIMIMPPLVIILWIVESPTPMFRLCNVRAGRTKA